MQTHQPRTVNPLPYADFRSDTATAPTPEMFAAMMKSSLGDDVYNEDESVKKLESYVAALCGHEAALYCASGTMTNQLAHRVHLCNPPQTAIVDMRSHVFNYEAGGISFHSQAAVTPIVPANGQYLTVEDIKSRLVLDIDVHYAPTRVVSLENTLNGTIMPLEEMVRIRQLTQEHGIKLHLDGARLWHASIATGIAMKEYCSHFDTISLCLSKGIGAPIGSILVGSEQTIKKAKHFRLLFGGGWRQAGFLAEAALWCIKTNWPSMEDAHRQARWLAHAFLEVGCHITNPVDTNMVWIDTSDAGFTVEELMAELDKEKIKISGSGCAARVVLHYQISDEVVETFIDVLRRMVSTPRMKVALDLVKTSMWEQPTSVFDGDIFAPTSQTTQITQEPGPVESTAASTTSHQQQAPTHVQRKPRAISIDSNVTPLLHNGSVDEDSAFSTRSSTVGSTNWKSRRVLEEIQDGPVDQLMSTPESTPDKSHQPVLRSNSSPPGYIQKKTRPLSAYEPWALDTAFLDERHSDHEENALQQGRFLDLDSPIIRRTQSLDLAITAEERAALVSGVNYPHTTDTKKANTLQYRISHNPASKAIKRATVRIARWGSILSRES
ncbi:Threonine aldolase [Mortierella polycephala]|uniref:Threonine aldolase n=1 Tax=Mortierella polycephala TaxID=41804 RepID=A0A9P6Q8P0_9FUNG|nr:Threonine aldolase [Mortierella polycephala]